jgi:SulP family sulfate permease
MLVASGVNFIDTAGCERCSGSRAMRDSGATLYLCNLKPGVEAAMQRSGFLDEFGAERVWPTKADAVRALCKRLAVRQCDACTVRIFTECHICLPNGMPRIVAATA